MEELVPWALGLLVGLAYPRWPGGLARGVAFAVLVIVLGSAVTIMNGEWSENPGYALIDIGQTWLAASIALYARGYLVSRAPRRLPGGAQR